MPEKNQPQYPEHKRRPGRPPRSIRILIADDHSLIRSGLMALLNQNPGMKCVGEARTGDEVLQLLAETSPHILVIDLNMPGTPTLEIIKTVSRQQATKLKIIVLTMHTTPFAMAESFDAGAHAFVSKEESIDTLPDIIREIRRGKSGLRSEGLRRQEAPRLTSRERTVLMLIARGYSGKEISRHMNISIKTLEVYRSRLLKKFNVEKSTDLVRVAMASGLLPDPLSKEPLPKPPPSLLSNDECAAPPAD